MLAAAAAEEHNLETQLLDLVPSSDLLIFNVGMDDSNQPPRQIDALAAIWQ